MQLTASSGAMPGFRQVVLKVLVSSAQLRRFGARQRVALLAALRRALDVGAEELQAVRALPLARASRTCRRRAAAFGSAIRYEEDDRTAVAEASVNDQGDQYERDGILQGHR